MSQVGLVQGLSFAPAGPPADLAALAGAVRAGVVRVQLDWGQVEAEPGRFDWIATDRLLAGLAGSGGLWLTVGCRSPWGTRTGERGLPGPPEDPAAFQRFVTALVQRCGRGVRYWQLESEPADAASWAGSATEYAELLGGFAAAVRRVAAGAVVVPGGFGEAADEASARGFFEVVCRRAAGAFDCFDVHLPVEPGRIRGHLEVVRDLLTHSGAGHVPLVVGEYGGSAPAQLVTAQVLALAGGAAVACYRPGQALEPVAPTLRMLAGVLAGSVGARRIEVSGRPDVYAFDVEFADPGRALQVFWREDGAGGEAELREALEWHWVHETIHVADADAQPVPMPAWASGRLALPLSGTPVLVSTDPLATAG